MAATVRFQSASTGGFVAGVPLNTDGRVSPHRHDPSGGITWFHNNDGRPVAIKNERHAMHHLFLPVLGNFYYVGGGSLGLILLILLIVVVLRH